MWPFSKLESEMNTGCTSGTFSCKGNTHLWTIWEPYIVKGIAHSIVFRSGVPFTESRQRRQCDLCGFTEDVRI